MGFRGPLRRRRRDAVHTGVAGEGVHYLLPGVVDRLRAHRATHAAERLVAGPAWQTQVFDGERLDLVFTTDDGGIVARQHIDELVRSKAAALGIDTTGLGTHVGRRTVVTAMSEDGVPLDDIARHVGHRSTTTTAGYVRSHKERDRATAKRAATLLDVPAVYVHIDRHPPPAPRPRSAEASHRTAPPRRSSQPVARRRDRRKDRQRPTYRNRTGAPPDRPHAPDGARPSSTLDRRVVGLLDGPLETPLAAFTDRPQAVVHSTRQRIRVCAARAKKSPAGG
ncbi:MAG: hypothetical protein EA389_08665 [Ilumatobacter sp.]|nr:MAG: hypothetical protein EA389_08665 [Ilumatobacter sp.]